jgi:L-lysine 6-transaminase
MVAVDLPSREARDAVLTDLRVNEHVLALGCGQRALRFRPALSVSEDEIDAGVAAVRRSVARVVPAQAEPSDASVDPDRVLQESAQ